MNADESRRRIRAHLLASADVKQRMADSCLNDVFAGVELIVAAFDRGGKLMLCGNGGSAADSQHIAAEFTNRLRPELERPALPALALTTDTSFLTAHANDSCFESVFERQIEALGHPGDVLVAISSSGNSENVIRAVHACRLRGIKTIGLLGRKGGQLGSLVDVPIIVPSENTQHVQETHIAVGHIIADLVESVLLERPLTKFRLNDAEVRRPSREAEADCGDSLPMSTAFGDSAEWSRAPAVNGSRRLATESRSSTET